MYSKRGGRVQVNMMQFYELVERVENLENALSNDNGKKEQVKKSSDEPTKKEVIAMLDEHPEIKYNPRDKKEVLLSLLNKEVDTCQDDQTESE